MEEGNRNNELLRFNYVIDWRCDTVILVDIPVWIKILTILALLTVYNTPTILDKACAVGIKLLTDIEHS